MKSKKILFFINGRVPTDEQKKFAIEKGARLRNAQAVPNKWNPETCDEVFGYVPEQYKDGKSGKVLKIDFPKSKEPKAPEEPKEPGKGKGKKSGDDKNPLG